MELRKNLIHAQQQSLLNTQGSPQFIPSLETHNIAQRLVLAIGEFYVGQGSKQNESLCPLGAQLQSNNVLRGLTVHF